jgi:hypothetical protein
MVNQETHGQARGVPAAGDQSAKGGLFCRLRIYVEGLPIEAPREFDSLWSSRTVMEPNS